MDEKRTARPRRRDERLYTVAELADAVAGALEHDYAGAGSGRVRDVPDVRAIRWYQTIGLMDRPVAMRGRTALYGTRQLLQVVAVKRRQALGHPIARIQEELLGATDAVLAEIARLPDSPASGEGDGEPVASGGGSRERFWARSPGTADDGPDPAGGGGDGDGASGAGSDSAVARGDGVPGARGATDGAPAEGPPSRSTDVPRSDPESVAGDRPSPHECAPTISSKTGVGPEAVLADADVHTPRAGTALLSAAGAAFHDATVERDPFGDPVGGRSGGVAAPTPGPPRTGLAADVTYGIRLADGVTVHVALDHPPTAADAAALRAAAAPLLAEIAVRGGARSHADHRPAAGGRSEGVSP